MVAAIVASSVVVVVVVVATVVAAVVAVVAAVAAAAQVLVAHSSLARVALEMLEKHFDHLFGRILLQCFVLNKYVVAVYS